jgi:hypothetical protein
MEAKRSPFIPQIRKIKVERTRLIPEIGKIEEKKTNWIEVKRTETLFLKLLWSPGIDSKELLPEPVFVNIYGAKEWIPRKQFRYPM